MILVPAAVAAVQFGTCWNQASSFYPGDIVDSNVGKGRCVLSRQDIPKRRPGVYNGSWCVDQSSTRHQMPEVAVIA